MANLRAPPRGLSRCAGLRTKCHNSAYRAQCADTRSGLPPGLLARVRPGRAQSPSESAAHFSRERALADFRGTATAIILYSCIEQGNYARKDNSIYRWWVPVCCGACLCASSRSAACHADTERAINFTTSRVSECVRARTHARTQLV